MRLLTPEGEINPSPLPSFDPASKIEKPENYSPTKASTKSEAELFKKFKGEVQFDGDPAEFSDVEPGKLAVIFRDTEKVRVKEDKKAVKALKDDEAKKVNDLFVKHKLKKAVDIAFGRTESEVDAQERKAEAYWGKDIPNLKSTIILEFPETFDKKALKEALKGLPSVLSVQSVPKVFHSATEISRFTLDNLSGTKPTDPDFAGQEKARSLNEPGSSWWWFNRHKVFQAWPLMSGAGLPTLVIMDDGFDVDSSALDRPNYVMGLARAFRNGVDEGTDVHHDPTTSQAKSHGSFMASLVGSPKDNSQFDTYGNGGICGIIPGMNIVPIKAVGGSIDFIAAIQHLTNMNLDNTKVIAISHHAGGNVNTGQRAQLLTQYDPFRVAVANAVPAGFTIVIPANNARDNQDINFKGDGGAVIVGGTQSDGFEWNRTDIPNAGSGYGNAVHVSAAAADLWGPAYYPHNGSRQYAQENGTSYATPMVAAVIAMCKNLYQVNGGTRPASDMPWFLKCLVWTTADIYPSNDRNYYGYYLNETGRNASPNFGARIRNLNMHNAFQIAKRPNGQPIVRIMNGDDQTWFAKNSNWDYRYTTSHLSYDTLIDLRSDSFAPGDMLDFITYNFGGSQAHGYQIYRNGLMSDEHLGGASEFRTPWGYIRGTWGEDNGAQDAGWHYGFAAPARY